jgi:hypothetical protein
MQPAEDKPSKMTMHSASDNAESAAVLNEPKAKKAESKGGPRPDDNDNFKKEPQEQKPPPESSTKAEHTGGKPSEPTTSAPPPEPERTETIPSYRTIHNQLSAFNATVSRIAKGLTGLQAWLVDVACIDKGTGRWELVKHAYNDAYETTRRHNTLLKAATRLGEKGWDRNAIEVAALHDEITALLKFIRPIERGLNEILSQFTSISKSKFSYWDSSRRDVLWDAIKAFRAAIAELQRHKGARFMKLAN